MSTRKIRGKRNLTARDRYIGDNTDISILGFLEALDTPISLGIWLRYKYGQHECLASLDVDPLSYNDRDSFALDLAAVSFLSKADFLKTGADTRSVALEKFWAAEAVCRDTNLRLIRSRYSLSGNVTLNAPLLSQMRRKIDLLLGPLSLSDVVDNCGWGPGASYHIRGNDTSGTNKFHNENGITHDLYPLHCDIASFAWPGWEFHRRNSGGYSLVPGGSLTTVPKNAKTDRTIAIEPGINLWYQKGIGSVIRSRLRRWGLNLNDQGVNQRLALLASRGRELATVDFSAASDTISRELVRELLPPDWFTLLDACRSKNVCIDDTWYSLEKFSSMGNGFTFELETLIFHAAALAVCEHFNVDSSNVSTYGDDVILPSAVLAPFSEFCNWIGFSLNADKTHSTGNYRESCGAHYWNGVDIKPLFLKKRIRNVEDVFKLANAIRRLAHRYNSLYGCAKRFHSVWSALRDCVPRSLWCVIPEGFGDGGFIVNFDEASPSRPRHSANQPSRWLDGWSFRHLQLVGKKRHSDQVGLLLDRLWLGSRSNAPNGDARTTGNQVTLRNLVEGRYVVSITPEWYNLGPWI